MLNGVFALLERSLRIDARAWPTHLTRLGLIAAIYFALCMTLVTWNRFGAPGLRFFEGIAYLDVLFMTLMGFGFFSTPITEEKEEDTLGLMLMAGISPLGILLGKSGGQLLQSLLLIAVQYPLMQLAVTMGGVSSLQISAVTLALLAYMVFLAGLGLLCSTLAPSSRKASSWVVISLSLYLILPYIANWVAGMHSRWIVAGGQELPLPGLLWTVLESIGSMCVLLQLSDILTTGFSRSPMSTQVISNGIAGMVFAGLSWLLFGVTARNLSTEASSRGMVAERRGFFRFHAGRPWGLPFVWKDFHFVSGGIGMILIRIVYYGSLASTVLVYEFMKGFPRVDEYADQCLILMSFSIAVDAALVLSRSLHEEIRGQTLVSLMMLPHSSNLLVYHKFLGALIGWLPGPIIELLFALCTATGRRDLWDIVWNEYDGWLLFLLFALIPHFAAVTSLYVRWGAVALAIGMTFGAYVILVLAASIFLIGPPNAIFSAVFDTLFLFICIACQICVLLRVPYLGSK